GFERVAEVPSSPPLRASEPARLMQAPRPKPSLSRLGEALPQASPRGGARPMPVYTPCQGCHDSSVLARAGDFQDVPARYCDCAEGERRLRPAESDRQRVDELASQQPVPPAGTPQRARWRRAAPPGRFDPRLACSSPLLPLLLSIEPLE